MLSDTYSDILYLSKPISKRWPMAVEHRAKQFLPFSALRGLEEAVREQDILCEEEEELIREKDCYGLYL